MKVTRPRRRNKRITGLRNVLFIKLINRIREDETHSGQSPETNGLSMTIWINLFKPPFKNSKFVLHLSVYPYQMSSKFIPSIIPHSEPRRGLLKPQGVPVISQLLLLA
jgi:hypothetical protein